MHLILDAAVQLMTVLFPTPSRFAGFVTVVGLISSVSAAVRHKVSLAPLSIATLLAFASAIVLGMQAKPTLYQVLIGFLALLVAVSVVLALLSPFVKPSQSGSATERLAARPKRRLPGKLLLFAGWVTWAVLLSIIVCELLRRVLDIQPSAFTDPVQALNTVVVWQASLQLAVWLLAVLLIAGVVYWFLDTASQQGQPNGQSTPIADDAPDDDRSTAGKS